jgi:hypothetical protein
MLFTFFDLRLQQKISVLDFCFLRNDPEEKNAAKKMDSKWTYMDRRNGRGVRKKNQHGS